MDYQLIIILLAMVLSSWFAGSETVFLSFRKALLSAWLQDRRKGARTVEFLTVRPERFLVTTLTGNNLANVLYSSVIAIWLSKYGVSESVIFVAAPLILLVFGETIPKAIGKQLADRIVIPVGIVLKGMRQVLFPIVTVVERLFNYIGRRFGISEQGMGMMISRIEIEGILEDPGSREVIPEESRMMTLRLLRLANRGVTEIMTPRTSVIAIPIDSSVKSARRKMLESGFSRLPCYHESMDDIAGFVDARALLSRVSVLSDVVRKLPMVPGTLTVISLLPWFRIHNTAFAGVIDEYGGFAGLVSLEDLIEELVGPIHDEYDVDHPGIHRLTDRVWLVDAKMRLSQFIQVVDIDLPHTHANSLAGLLIEMHGGIPKAGCEFNLPGVVIRVIGSNRRGVKFVRLTLKKDSEKPGES